MDDEAERLGAIFRQATRRSSSERVRVWARYAAPSEDGRLQLRTFRIRPGAPHGQSFAADIAEQHGISFPQLVELLRQRGFDSAELP